jgi:hypothetical protein
LFFCTGLSFWKSTARKVFAVQANDKKEDVVVIDDHEKNNDVKQGITNELPLFQSYQIIQSYFVIHLLFIDAGMASATAVLMDAIESQTNFLKSFLDEKFENAAKNRLLIKLEELFKCVICQETAKPPIQFGACCGSVLGCEPCLEKWYEENENCPKCRALFGKSDLHTLRGFDDIFAKSKDDQP